MSVAGGTCVVVVGWKEERAGGISKLPGRTFYAHVWSALESEPKGGSKAPKGCRDGHA